jgi:hypothetical protein
MNYTRSLLESDVERLLRQMVKKLEEATERCLPRPFFPSVL